MELTDAESDRLWGLVRSELFNGKSNHIQVRLKEMKILFLPQMYLVIAEQMRDVLCSELNLLQVLQLSDKWYSNIIVSSCMSLLVIHTITWESVIIDWTIVQTFCSFSSFTFSSCRSKISCSFSWKHTIIVSQLQGEPTPQVAGEY